MLMKKIGLVITIIFLLSCSLWGRQGIVISGSSMNVAEVDGSPSGTITLFKFPNGTITDNGDGTYTYTPATNGDITLVGSCLTGDCSKLLNGATSAGYLDFGEDSDNGANYSRLYGPENANNANWDMHLPAETGTICSTGSVCSGYQGVLTNSAGLAGALSDETGTGLAVFNNTPSLTTPVIGAATGTSLGISGLVYWGSATAEADEGSITLPTITAHYSGHGFVRVSSSGAVQDSAEFESGSDGTVNLIRGTANIVVGAACADTKICISTAATQNPIIVKSRNGAQQVEIEFWYH